MGGGGLVSRAFFLTFFWWRISFRSFSGGFSGKQLFSGWVSTVLS